MWAQKRKLGCKVTKFFSFYKKKSCFSTIFRTFAENFRTKLNYYIIMTEKITNIIELAQAPMRTLVLTDQQIQQLSLEEVQERYAFLEETLTAVLDYDVVISDTNIWLELLVGHTSSHSDPKVNARLQFERQLEFISKLMKHRGGKFVMMGETYEEIDRFAALQDPTNHKEADFTDSIVCLNAAARLAKRLILAQQRENRLRIEGISAESHHASFADPAIVHRVVELFAEGKKVLLLTNDASVAIRSIGLCDDLQRTNNISDADWDSLYAPLRPMVFTFDDLKLLDYYTRQFHYLQIASGKAWMADVEPKKERTLPQPLTLWEEAFRPGDKRRGDNLFITEQEMKTTAELKTTPEQKTQKTSKARKTQKNSKPQQPKPKQEQIAQQPKQEPQQEQKPKQEAKQEAQPKQPEEPKKTENKAESKTKSTRKPRSPRTSKTTKSSTTAQETPAAPTAEAPTAPSAPSTPAAPAATPKKTTRRRSTRTKKTE